jgi:ligand-binding SRPBCC domain-containing protein
MKRVHVLEREQVVPQAPEAAFEFFSDAFALARITPPWLDFRVVTPAPLEMAEGTLIEYALRLHRVPIRWLTRIEVWEPPRRFIDVQLNGPYSVWEHTHSFVPRGAGTAIVDRVRYGLPFGPLGELARIAIVRRDLERIFDYRRDAVAELLGVPGIHKITER